jgi:transcriptional regulator with XRE-family HTH domain
MPSDTVDAAALFAIQTPEQAGLYLKALRRSRGLTQTALGAQVGVTGARISDIERGAGSVALAQLLQLIHHLGARLSLHQPAAVLQPDVDTAAVDW